MTVHPPPRRGCEWLQELAPQVALGLLTGRERGDALAHLERCEACRAEVAALSGTADEILLATPEVAPPAGFDQRVLAAVAAQRASGDDGPDAAVPAPHRGQGSRPVGRVVALAVAAAVLVVVGVAAAVLRGGDEGGGGGGPAVVAAEMRTGRGRVVGEVTLAGDRPVDVTVDVPEWAELVERWEGEASGGYWLAVETRDGSRSLTPVPGDDGMPEARGQDGGWTVSVEADQADVATVSVVDGQGRTWCSGTFPA
jgi:hypothetical protein